MGTIWPFKNVLEKKKEPLFGVIIKASPRDIVGKGEKSRRRVVLIKRQRRKKKKRKSGTSFGDGVFRLATQRTKEGGREGGIRSRHNYATLRADLIILGEQPEPGRVFVPINYCWSFTGEILVTAKSTVIQKGSPV